MWIILLLFTNLVFSDDDFSAEKYCFNGTTEAAHAETKFSAISVNSDKVKRDDACLVVQMRPHRRELIQRYFRSSYPNVQVSFSSAEAKREPCRLKVEKIKSSLADATSVGINSDLTASLENKNLSATEEMQIETLGEFELTIDQDQVKGHCRSINATRYDITLEVRKNSRPLVPFNLPPGSVVVINSRPEPQETSALKTQLQLSQGEKIEIGEIVRSINIKERKVDINPDLKHETANKNYSEKVFLSLR